MESFDLKCIMCGYQFLDADLEEIKCFFCSDGSGVILFNCPKCGQELKSTFIVNEPKMTENFKPLEMIKITEKKNWELIPHDRNKNNDEHESIYIWADYYELDKGVFRFFDEKEGIIEIPEILIYEIKEKGE